jgi:hypothetical protein
LSLPTGCGFDPVDAGFDLTAGFAESFGFSPGKSGLADLAFAAALFFAGLSAVDAVAFAVLRVALVT